MLGRGSPFISLKTCFFYTKSASLLKFKFASDKVWMRVKLLLPSPPSLQRRLEAAVETPLRGHSWDGDTAPASSWSESGMQCFRILIASFVRPSVHPSPHPPIYPCVHPSIPPSISQILVEHRLGFRCCVRYRGLRDITRQDSSHTRIRSDHRESLEVLSLLLTLVSSAET